MIKLYEGAGVNRIILTSTNKELELLDMELDEIQSDNIKLLDEFEDKNIKLEDKIYDIKKNVLDYLEKLLIKFDKLEDIPSEIEDIREELSLNIDKLNQILKD